MFKTTDKTSQLNLFSSPSNLLKKRAAKKYDDPKAWHNLFFQLVTSRIDEGAFSPLFKEGNMGAPNASIRVLVAMSILKEGFGCSDEDLFEKCEFDLLTRKALGFVLLDETAPSPETYYLFRRRICQYEERCGENLMETCFQQVTGEQCKQFNISGKSVRMDSKLIGSNIAWYSRYELIHLTLCKVVKSSGLRLRLNPSLRRKVELLIQEDAGKTVYRSDRETIARRIVELGQVIYQVLVRIKADEKNLLYRVFNEQYTVEKGLVTPRAKKELKADSVQNPHDPDAGYRHKGEQKVKGYSVNLTETLASEETPSLITDVQVKSATAADNGYVQEAIESTQTVTREPIEKLYADGAYQNEANRNYEGVELITATIQGVVPRYDLTLREGELIVFDSKTDTIIPALKIPKLNKWRIETGDKNKYRYFTPAEIQLAEVRRKIQSYPPEETNKRNNVEATIFQYCFHSRNNKTRYRGLLKHRLFSYARCMWVNCRRLIIFQNGRGSEWQNVFSGIFVVYMTSFRPLLNIFGLLKFYLKKIINPFFDQNVPFSILQIPHKMCFSTLILK
jgi:hypothetical protein